MVNKSIIFNGKKIRKILQDGQRYFSVVDLIFVLTDSINSRDYWCKVKMRELENGIELLTFCQQLKLQSSDGKKYLTNCANKQEIIINEKQ